MTNRPKGWLAALLGFFVPPLGFLYVGQWKWAVGVAVTIFLLAGFLFAFGGSQEGLTLLVQLVFACSVSRIAYLQAGRFAVDRLRPGYSRWYGLWFTLLLFVSLLLAFRAFLYEPFRVPSGSMQPTLKPESKFIAQKWGYGNYAAFGIRLMRAPVSQSIERGDILVIEFPPNRKLHYIERIIGLPGDKIEYRNKALFINGQETSRRPMADYLEESAMRYYNQYLEKLNNKEYAVLLDKDRPSVIQLSERFAYFENCSYDTDVVSCVVPAGHYYALGDNRDNSFDSRYWGFVPRDHMVGKLVHAFP